MFAALYYLVLAGRSADPVRAIVFGLVGLVVGRFIRSISHLRRRPSDIVLLPLVTLVIMFIALPVKTYAFYTMNKQGWLTRSRGEVGGEGQTEASLTGQEAAHALAS